MFLDVGKTRRGKTRETIPGELVHGGLDQVTCKGCLSCLEADRRHAEHRRDWERRQADRAAEQERWWRAYDAYLESPQWRRRRELVLRRARSTCEGCGERRATQVHHLSYDRVSTEMLFELVAVCDRCHASIHNKSAA